MPFEMLNCPVATSQYWNVVFGRDEGECGKDTEGMQTMRTLGRNMAWLLKNLKSGEASGDSVKMRSAAVAAGIPVTTTLAGFAAAVAGLSQPHDECSVYSLQEYQHKA